MPVCPLDRCQLLSAIAVNGFYGDTSLPLCASGAVSGGTHNTGTRERASREKAVPCGPGVSLARFTPATRMLGWYCSIALRDGVGRAAVLDDAAHRKRARSLRCRTPPAWLRTGFRKADSLGRAARMQHNQRPLKRLCQRMGRRHRGRRRLVPLHGQQHRAAGSGTELARIPVRRHGQHRARRQPHQLLGDGAHHHRPGALLPSVPITISPASYCRATSTSICATAPWRISEWL